MMALPEKTNHPKWELELNSTHLSEKIKQSLRTVKDPEIGMDIIQLGLVRNVSISEDKLKIVMILTTPYCPYAPMIMETARKKAEEISGLPTEISYGSDIWDPSMMEDGANLNWGLF